MMGFEEELKKHARKFWRDLNHDELHPCYEEEYYVKGEDVDFWVRVEDSVAVCKDLCISKTVLVELLKKFPRRFSMPYIPLEWDKNGEWTQFKTDVDKIREELEGLLKKGDTTK